MANPRSIAKATQEFVPVQEVRDGIVVLKDGSLRGVLMVSSLNFALKSQDEQESILFQFQNFLNSLDFSVQIFVQSRDLDIRPYLALLEERGKAQTDELMVIQVREYMGFIREFTESANIMTKNFFVIVPYSPAMLSTKKGPLGSLFGAEEGHSAKDRLRSFEENRVQLQQRVSVVEQGLVRTGLRLVQLGTEEAVELFYKMFNPGELDKPISLLGQN